MRKLECGFFVLLLGLVYIITFRQIWLGIFVPDVLVYLGVFLVLTFLTYMFLHGAYYIVHMGKKVSADICMLSSMDEMAFKAYFKRDKTGLDENQVCIVRYTIDDGTQYELIGINKIGRSVHGKSADIYVLVHKTGVKKDYEIRTNADVLRNVCVGIPLAIALMGWIVLFVLRGL